MGEAEFSNCGQYRYFLSRRWDKGESCVFVMLNPHKANESQNDPTIRRCIGFATDWGYSGIEVVNLFGYCCKNPIDLQKIEDPVGDENDQWLVDACVGKDVIVAWGNHGRLKDRSSEVMSLLTSLPDTKIFGFGFTRLHEPLHPLYLKGDRSLQQLSGF